MKTIRDRIKEVFREGQKRRMDGASEEDADFFADKIAAEIIAEVEKMMLHDDTFPNWLIIPNNPDWKAFKKLNGCE